MVDIDLAATIGAIDVLRTALSRMYGVGVIVYHPPRIDERFLIHAIEHLERSIEHYLHEE